MITLERGLKISIVILELLRDKEALKDIPVTINCFTNCREQGLTYVCHAGKSFTWCTYEHRNTDSIIINGKPGYVNLNGDLPYSGDSKWEYLKEFGYNEFDECADALTEMILDFYKKNK